MTIRKYSNIQIRQNETYKKENIKIYTNKKTKNLQITNIRQTNKKKTYIRKYSTHR